MVFRSALLIAGSLCLLNASRADEPRFDSEDLEYYERKVRPLLSEHCYACHASGAKTIHGGLRLDTETATEQGGDSGPLLVPGKPEESLLIEAIRYDGDIQMPPEGKMPDAEIAQLTAWVRRGAPQPPSVDPPQRADGRIDFEKGRSFWSFQPLRGQPLPAVADRRWPRMRLDFFVLAAMEKEGLSPSPPADRAALMRRIHFDLIGLPPAPEQVQAFVDDDSPQAYQRLVDRLLESPLYGQRWSRMWLDMARYTDRTASWLYQTGQAHLYRDWVVNAFNDDIPYDEFVHRQLATDLMSATGPDDLPALGLVSLSPTYWKELKLPCEIIKVIVADEWEERVDTVTRTFLGLTVACARCHDHKFDPISSEDYYALAGVFASCRQIDRPLISEQQYEPVRLAKQQVAKLEKEVEALKKSKPPQNETLKGLSQNINEIKSATAEYDTPMANALSEESMFVVRAGKTAQEGTRLEYQPRPQDLPLFIRGNPNRPGPVVPRRFLTVLSKDPQPFRNGSGRLELADSITSDAAPLAARVIVNRIWLAHFGQGIVTTPSNFGQQGARPTHPQLLDDLATRFVADGWSIKKLHREILLSATWQQSSAYSQRRVEIDPENRWLSRMSRRRLDFEAWRDAMLAASGVLSLESGGPSIDLEDAGNRRRSLYATVHRRDMSTTLQVHDFPDPTQHSPQRKSTVTAIQGLYALNGPLVAAQSQSLANRLGQEFPDNRSRIRRAYQLLFSRSPTPREYRLALEYLNGPAEESAAERVAKWQQYAHVLLASNEFWMID
jgi:mono/diheme cytochrome c family protein